MDKEETEYYDEQAEAQKFARYINDLGASFDVLCEERHKEGEEKYGPITWAGNDVVRMMMEELADTANYCRYQYIKLMMLQQLVEEGLPMDLEMSGKNEQEITIGIGAFKGTKDVGWSPRR